jgi:class 3 adenylate cyclase
VSEPPQTRFATTSDGLHIAFRVEGSGSLEILEFSNGTTFSFDATDEQPRWQRWIDHLTSYGRLARFDFRGIGLSDPISASDTLSVEKWASDALSVMDEAGMERAAVLATSQGALGAMMLAATYPERITALVIVNGYARIEWAEDYEIGFRPNFVSSFGEALVEPSDSPEDDLPLMLPSLAADEAFHDWWRRTGHRGASPAMALTLWRMAATDLRAVVPSVSCPTLVIHARDNSFVPAAHGRYLAEHLPDARYVELDTADHLPWGSDADFAGEIEEFLTGARGTAEAARSLATVLFTDIVGSTEQASALGDRAWRERLETHDRVVNRQLARFGGQLVKATGDGVLALFDGPARAVQCAGAIRDALRQIGIPIRAGVHTGEIERRGDDVAGIAVHIAQRVEARAAADEVLVSRTVVDLVVGSGLPFEDRGEYELKGVPGRWGLFAFSA